MLNSKAKVRLFVEQELGAGMDLAVRGSQAHYLLHVMRMQTGKSLLLFNGKDGEWLSQISKIDKNLCAVTLETQTREQQGEEGPWLSFAPIKKSAVDFVAQKATELGVSRISPVVTARTTSGRVNVRRLHANAVEAAEQSGRLSVPEVTEPVSLESLVLHWPSSRALFVLHGDGRGRPIADVFSDIQHTSNKGQVRPPGFLIGPEGGFSSSELDVIDQLPCVLMVDMGPRTLRCETAALSALACWQAMAGDWRDPRIAQHL